jgi:hypothetical protein
MQKTRGFSWRPAAVLAAALCASVCGGSSKKAAPPTAVVIPTPVPTPAPAPTPDVVSATCERLPLGSATFTCRDESPSFMVEVNDAIDELMRVHPEYFSGDTVTNLGGYYVGIIKILDRKNICAAFDGEELAVKSSNDFSDQYKLITSWQQVRRFYIGTCYPALFPLARSQPPASPPGCRLAPSSEIACGRPDPQFFGDVEAAIDRVIAQKPALFDPTDRAPGTDWPAVTDMLAYENAVIAELATQGYCGKFDGEEIQIKKTDEFSEHYDINLADKYVRRGPGSFRGSCYPAAF